VTAPPARDARPNAVGLGSLFALGVNGIVGVGIFFTPGSVAALVPGSAGALAYPLTALLLAPVALTAAFLGRALSVDGGPYVWARSAFGAKVGWIVGWVAGVSALISTAAVFAGVAAQLAVSLPLPGGRAAWVVVCAAALASIAVTGLRPSAWVWNALTITKLVPLGLLLVFGFGLTRAALAPPAAVDAVAPAWGRALLVALFPLQGFEVVPVLSGSVRGGRHTLTVATFGSLGFAAALYAAIQLVCVSAVPGLGGASAPLAQAAAALGGADAGWLARVVAVGANVSALGIAFGMVVMTPRYVAALGGQQNALAFLGRVNGRGVPIAALLATVFAIVLLGSLESLESLFVLSSSAVLIQYVAASAALIWLSLRRAHGLTPWYVAPALLALGAVGMLSSSIELRELVVLAAFLAVGGAVLLASPGRER
jgi:APA family basic amino acid/polyamine antiporter